MSGQFLSQKAMAVIATILLCCSCAAGRIVQVVPCEELCMNKCLKQVYEVCKEDTWCTEGGILTCRDECQGG